MSQEKSIDESSKTLASKALEGSLDTIKEILVGEYFREVGKTISSLQDRIAREFKNREEQAMQRFHSLESYLRKEFEIVRNDLKREQEERLGALDFIATELKNAVKSFDQKLAKSNFVASSQLSELRDQMLNLSRALSEEGNSRYQLFREELEKAAISLDRKKPDTQFLAELFNQMSGALGAADITPRVTKKSA